VDPNDQKKTACYDIDVEVDDPLKAQMSNFLASTTNQQEIASLDAKVWGSPPPFQGSPVSELGELGAGCVLVWGLGMNSSSHIESFQLPLTFCHLCRSMRPSNPSTS